MKLQLTTLINFFGIQVNLKFLIIFILKMIKNCNLLATLKSGNTLYNKKDYKSLKITILSIKTLFILKPVSFLLFFNFNYFRRKHSFTI